MGAEHGIERQLLHARHLRIGTCRLDRSLNEVQHEGRRTRLTPKAAAVLEVLVHFGGQPVSKERLLLEVWRGEFPTEDVVTNAISQLRKAFGDGARDSSYIRTVPRVGYTLLAEVGPVDVAREPVRDTLEFVREELDDALAPGGAGAAVPSRAWLALLVVLLVLVLALGAGILIGGARWRAKAERAHVIVPLSAQVLPYRVTERRAAQVDRDFVASLSELRRDETPVRWQMPNPARIAQGGNHEMTEAGVRHRARISPVAGSLPRTPGLAMVVLVLRGRLRWEAPDHALDLPAGSVIVDDGRAAQRLHADAAERTEVLCLWPDPAHLREPAHGLLPLLHAPDTRVADAMRRLADTLARAGMRRLQGETLQAWVDAVQDAQRDCDEAIERCHGRTPQRRRELFVRLARARALLAAPEAGIDVAHCARAARLSTSHFVRLFHKVFGEAPHQYRSRERMQRARRLLVDTDLPVREVMRRVGFESPPIFARAFRRHFGASATALRNTHAA